MEFLEILKTHQRRNVADVRFCKIERLKVLQTRKWRNVNNICAPEVEYL